MSSAKLLGGARTECTLYIHVLQGGASQFSRGGGGGGANQFLGEAKGKFNLLSMSH